jgi:hypothetical protein
MKGWICEMYMVESAQVQKKTLVSKVQYFGMETIFLVEIITNHVTITFDT